METTRAEKIKTLVSESTHKRGDNRNKLISEVVEELKQEGIITHSELNAIFSDMKKQRRSEIIKNLTSGFKIERRKKISYALYEKPIFSYISYKKKNKEVLVFDDDGAKYEAESCGLSVSRCVTNSKLSSVRVPIVSFQKLYIAK